MMFDEGGVKKKYVCPVCHGDAIGESGLGGGLLHCFGPCMCDISKEDCQIVPVQTEAEAQALSQPAY